MAFSLPEQSSLSCAFNNTWQFCMLLELVSSYCIRSVKRTCLIKRKLPFVAMSLDSSLQGQS